MGKYMELLDTGVRIVARFHSHCPQTARLYYHPPAHNHNDHRDYVCNAKDGEARGSFGFKEGDGVDSTDFILHSVVL